MLFIIWILKEERIGVSSCVTENWVVLIFMDGFLPLLSLLVTVYIPVTLAVHGFDLIPNHSSCICASCPDLHASVSPALPLRIS